MAWPDAHERTRIRIPINILDYHVVLPEIYVSRIGTGIGTFDSYIRSMRIVHGIVTVTYSHDHDHEQLQ